MELDPFARDRGAHDRRLRHGRGTGLPLLSAVSTRWPRNGWRERSRQARLHGYLGDDVMEHGFRFDVELRRGAGAYICGEETALFNSIEGKRGEPRNKPPFPVTSGVFGKPTAINNVGDADQRARRSSSSARTAYSSVGTEDSTGTRLFCLSGHVERPGVYEHPHGRDARRRDRGGRRRPRRQAPARRCCSVGPRAASWGPIGSTRG